MELQVRIAYETAQMLEFLKDHYQEQNGIKFSKSEVLSKAILDSYDDWTEIDWNKTPHSQIDEKEFKDKITDGSLRPKFQLSNSIDTKIDELRSIIKPSVGARSVTIGAAIKIVLRQVVAEIQASDDCSVEKVVNATLDSYLAKDLPDETKEMLQKYTDELLENLDSKKLLKE